MAQTQMGNAQQFARRQYREKVTRVAITIVSAMDLKYLHLAVDQAARIFGAGTAYSAEQTAGCFLQYRALRVREMENECGTPKSTDDSASPLTRGRVSGGAG